MRKSRLRIAADKYCEQLHEWLTNPKNADLPNEIVVPKLDSAFHTFFQELIFDEQECADFISKGGIIDEMEFLPLVFEHFKSRKIYEAIKSNCEASFSGIHSIESDELQNARKMLILHMQNTLCADEQNPMTDIKTQ